MVRGAADQAVSGLLVYRAHHSSSKCFFFLREDVKKMPTYQSKLFMKTAVGLHSLVTLKSNRLLADSESNFSNQYFVENINYVVYFFFFFTTFKVFSILGCVCVVQHWAAVHVVVVVDQPGLHRRALRHGGVPLHAH